MSWNGSDNTANTSRNRGATPRRTSPFRGLAAGLIVVVLGGAALWFFLGRAVAPTTAAHEKKGGKIAEVKPAVVTNAVKQAEKAAEKVGSPVEKLAPTTTVGMVIKTPTGKTYVIKREIKHDFLYRINGVEVRDRDIFTHDSERVLDAILCCEPGDRFYADFNKDKFREDLGQALIEKIEFTDEDNDLERERKQAVIDAKEELRKALRNGEDPAQIVEDARKEIMKVAEIRDNVLNSVAELSRNAESEQDIDDCIDAANKMLEPYGVKPILKPSERKERAARAVLKRKLMKESKK